MSGPVLDANLKGLAVFQCVRHFTEGFSFENVNMVHHEITADMQSSYLWLEIKFLSKMLCYGVSYFAESKCRANL